MYLAATENIQETSCKEHAVAPLTVTLRDSTHNVHISQDGALSGDGGGQKGVSSGHGGPPVPKDILNSRKSQIWTERPAAITHEHLFPDVARLMLFFVEEKLCENTVIQLVGWILGIHLYNKSAIMVRMKKCTTLIPGEGEMSLGSSVKHSSSFSTY